MNILSRRLDEVLKQRDELAKKLLLDGINHDKISYREKERNGGLSFSYSTALYGLIIADQTSEEMKLLDYVDGLCDGRIKRIDNEFEIPGDVTEEEKKMFTRTPSPV